MKNKLIVFLLFSLILFLSACAPSSNSIQTAIAQTQNAESSAIDTVVISDDTIVPTLTYTFEPTLTPKPTDTVEPTQIPPTPTLQPSDTPEPTIAPEPLVLTGAGDSVVDIDWPETLGLMIVKGNAAGRHFSIVPYKEDGSRMVSIVNTSDPYEGIRPFNFDGDYAARLEISASGEWAIEIVPLSEANTFSVPGTYAGRDDDVLILIGSKPDLATISGNAEGHHFSIIPYSGGGKRMVSVVNTSDPYEGTVIIPKDAVILVISCVGDWSISITTTD